VYRNLVHGLNVKIPLNNDIYTTPINFDNAATTPPFRSVMKEINSFSPWYSSIHRGTGYKSEISSEYYDQARNDVLNFVNGDKDNDTVIFLKNTTECINKLSYRIKEEIEGGIVLTTRMEHHSNLLPWRLKYPTEYVETDKCGRLSIYDLNEKLKRYRGKIKLMAITGASNVTGYTNPIHEIARLVHDQGGKILVDGAQLVPHHPIDMKSSDSLEHIDYLTFSAHKMYAPFGTGVLIGPKKLFEKGSPEYPGGGTISFVSDDSVFWAEPPEKEEAGTPNVMGAVALSNSIKTLESLGMENIDNYELNLTYYCITKMKNIPHIILYCDLDFNNKISIIPFNIEGIPHEILARILSEERGISVRNGCFCAQPYVQRLLNILPNSYISRPGIVRISFGLYNTYEEVDILIDFLTEISSNIQYYKGKYKNLLYY